MTAVVCIMSFFTDYMVFVGCVLPSCPKSSNLVVPLYRSLNMLEGDIGMFRILCLFLNFLSLKNIVIIDIYLKSSIYLYVYGERS